MIENLRQRCFLIGLKYIPALFIHLSLFKFRTDDIVNFYSDAFTVARDLNDTWIDHKKVII